MKVCLPGLAVAAVLFPLAPAADLPKPTVQLAGPAAGDQDDMCVWVHPTDPGKSVVVTSDKAANKLFVYDLDGKTLQSLDVKHPGNIDSRPGFPLAGGKADIVAVNLRDEKLLAVFKVDPESRKLTRIDDGAIATGENYGGCLYKSARTGKFFAVVTSYSGAVTQLELTDGGGGKVKGKKVRAWKAGGVCEGAVADDEAGKLYISEESKGVWELGAEPDAEAPGRLAIKVGENELKGDVEGLAIFARPGGTGYLLVSDQGKNLIRVYRREGKHEYVGAFGITGMGDTDGIEVVAVGLGAKFPNGLFLCHTGSKSPCPVLLTPWDAIAGTFSPPLALPAKPGPR
jgi:3-phytase